MRQSELHAASVALSRAADKRKSLINIHKNGYTATLRVQILTTINLFRNVQVGHCYNTTNDIHYLYKLVKHKND